MAVHFPMVWRSLQSALAAQAGSASQFMQTQDKRVLITGGARLVHFSATAQVS
jgi:hypothetical protein